MPSDVLEVTKKFMRDPIRILVKKEELTLEGIRQFYINVEREVGPGARGGPAGVGRIEPLTGLPSPLPGVEAGHAVRLVRDPDHHAGGHLHQHPKEGGLAH